jgi:hypothetical protein
MVDHQANVGLAEGPNLLAFCRGAQQACEPYEHAKIGGYSRMEFTEAVSYVFTLPPPGHGHRVGAHVGAATAGGCCSPCTATGT